MAKGGGIPPYVRHTHGVACKDEENGECRQSQPGKMHRPAWTKSQCGRGLQREDVHATLPSFPVAGEGIPMISGKSFSVAAQRSEEHTSELQSLMRISYAVFCLQKQNEQKKHRTQ